MNKSEYIEQIKLLATQYGHLYNILPSVITSISCIETEFGQNDIFIKCKSMFRIYTSENIEPVFDTKYNKVVTLNSTNNEKNRFIKIFNTIDESIVYWCKYITETKNKKNILKFKEILGITDYRKAIILLEKNGYQLESEKVINTILSNELSYLDTISSLNTFKKGTLYVVRKSWSNNKSQIFETSNKDDAFACAKSSKGYKVYDKYGHIIYDPWSNTSPNININTNNITYSKTKYYVQKTINSDPILVTTNLNKAKILSDSAGYSVYLNSGECVYDYKKKPDTNNITITKPLILLKNNKIKVNTDTILFSSSVSNHVIGIISSTHVYTLDEFPSNNRIRVSNQKMGKCIGYINIYDIIQ